LSFEPTTAMPTLLPANLPLGDEIIEWNGTLEWWDWGDSQTRQAAV